MTVNLRYKKQPHSMLHALCKNNEEKWLREKKKGNWIRKRQKLESSVWTCVNSSPNQPQQHNKAIISFSLLLHRWYLSIIQHTFSLFTNVPITPSFSHLNRSECPESEINYLTSPFFSLSLCKLVTVLHFGIYHEYEMQIAFLIT